MTTDLRSADSPADLTPADLTPEVTPDVTHDLWYDGSLRLLQPASGFRATTDAVLLAAAVPILPEGSLYMEPGAGCGAATLAFARRAAPATPTITAVEKNGMPAGLLARNIREAGFDERIKPVRADIFNPAAAGAWQGVYDCVFCNPPFNDAASSLSDNPVRRQSMAAADLGHWIKAAIAMLKPGRGQLVLISRADRLHEIMDALSAHGGGDIAAKPVHSDAASPAIRVLVTARRLRQNKSAKRTAPLTLLPPFVMREGEGLTPAMHAVARKRGAIDLAVQTSGSGKAGFRKAGFRKA